MEGRVKRVLSKGFGFIETDSGIDFFFHHTAVVDCDFRQLLLKQVNSEIVIVEFDNDPSAKDAPRAINVKVKQSLS